MHPHQFVIKACTGLLTFHSFQSGALWQGNIWDMQDMRGPRGPDLATPLCLSETPQHFYLYFWQYIAEIWSKCLFRTSSPETLSSKRIRSPVTIPSEKRAGYIIYMTSATNCGILEDLLGGFSFKTFQTTYQIIDCSEQQINDARGEKKKKQKIQIIVLWYRSDEHSAWMSPLW